MAVLVPIKWLPHASGMSLPFYATSQSAGLDVCAAVSEPLNLQPHEYKPIPLGFALALPEGYEAQIRSRSGLASKFGICVLNAPGTIDADYRGEVQVLLVNFSEVPFKIERGMRIAQMVITEFTRTHWDVVSDLPESVRNDRGFGSTGV